MSKIGIFRLIKTQNIVYSMNQIIFASVLQLGVKSKYCSKQQQLDQTQQNIVSYKKLQMNSTQKEQYQSSSDLSEESSSNSSTLSKKNQEKSHLAEKKKRIVRKKYRPRKKDVFLHTICVLNKNNFAPQNCIIQSFLMAQNRHSIQVNMKTITSLVDKKDSDYLRKLMSSIIFSRKLSSPPQNIYPAKILTSQIILSKRNKQIQNVKKPNTQVPNHMNLLPMTQTAQYRNSQFNNFDNNYRVVG